ERHVASATPPIKGPTSDCRAKAAPHKGARCRAAGGGQSTSTSALPLRAVLQLQIPFGVTRTSIRPCLPRNQGTRHPRCLTRCQLLPVSKLLSAGGQARPETI